MLLKSSLILVANCCLLNFAGACVDDVSTDVCENAGFGADQFAFP